ncbi:DUF1450 domain-containing protein [Hathewaya limosa]|uniref:Uncharacterized protein YuzB (UPF0349 family) n=1 Tax=Hathewaya limosa TaxID=1536 RepID=A0ABU0JQM3_HATLI|nr:DUF1450 domain-containing protein [Hathewaya limosa]MDQ0479368.1 uncharacterized protein YuzB (UPF0349 family) [Hathewaya limosa]
MQISFCQENEGAKEVIELLEKYHPEFKVTMNKCLGECGKCTHKYIVRVEGKFLEADTAQELYDKIIKFFV